MSGHTKGPWFVQRHQGSSTRSITTTPGGARGDIANVWSGIGSKDVEADARLIASAPDLLAAVESEYIFLADIHNEWPGRHTAEGQTKLCRLRDLICKATGREAQDVQDDYSSRNLVNVVEGGAS